MNSTADKIAKQLLITHKRAIDADIRAYCQRVLQATEEDFGSYSREALAAYCDVLERGGKRLRGALVLHAYKMAGGTNDALAAHAARAIEMLHAYLLVIDDICDRSSMRRGAAAAHQRLQTVHAAGGWKGDGIHFGMSTAILAANLGGHLAQRELATLDADPAVLLTILARINKDMAVTHHGQINDVFLEVAPPLTDGHVEQMLAWKTTYYSFVNPLFVGVLLGGGSEQEAATLKDYAMHLGLAFQLTDDILGTFGKERQSGKSPLDDLREGKNTLLVARALAHANEAQQQYLRLALGNAGLTAEQHATCQRIIRETGALDYVHKLALQHASKATIALESVPAAWRPRLDFLRGLTQLVVERSA